MQPTSDAQHFSTELTVKMSKKRKALPFILYRPIPLQLQQLVMILTLIKFLVGRLKLFGFTNDIFIPISTSGNSKNIINGKNC